MPPQKKPKTTTTGRAPRDEKPKLRSFIVTYDISGRATAEVMATSLDEARAKALALDVVAGSARLIEWDFEDVRNVEENS